MNSEQKATSRVKKTDKESHDLEILTFTTTQRQRKYQLSRELVSFKMCFSRKHFPNKEHSRKSLLL